MAIIIPSRSPARESAFPIGLDPAELGLDPVKFTGWRQPQIAGIGREHTSQVRFRGHGMPTGTGKSLFYVANALLRGKRALILTSTKSLQDQLMSDFGPDAPGGGCGLVTIKGRANYPCGYFDDCEQGSDYGCPHRGDNSCAYRRSLNRAKSAPLVCTNYGYLTTKNRYRDISDMGDFDLIVLDEAHDAPAWASQAMTVKLTHRDQIALQRPYPAGEGSAAPFRGWARELLPRAQANAKRWSDTAKISPDDRSARREAKLWSAIASKLQTLAGMDGDWISEVPPESGGTIRLITPIWPGPYCQSLIWQDIPEVLLVSATLTRKTFELLGLEPDQYEFWEYDSSFPAGQSVLTFVDLGVRVTKDTPTGDLIRIVESMDSAIAARMDRRGVVHSHAFRHSRFIREYSRYTHLMLIPETGADTAPMLKQFVECPPPVVMVSPSLTTGYDFAGDRCRYQMFPKVPFPYSKSALHQARERLDPKYGLHCVAQTLVQATGRGDRFRGDWCENLIFDGQIKWVIWRNRDLYPKWWLDKARHDQRYVLPNPRPIDWSGAEAEAEAEAEPMSADVEFQGPCMEDTEDIPVSNPLPPPAAGWTPNMDWDDDIPF